MTNENNFTFISLFISVIYSIKNVLGFLNKTALVEASVHVFSFNDIILKPYQSYGHREASI